MTDILQVWRGEGRHEITLNRPRRRNAINRELNTAIVAALRAFDGDADACVAVLTGADPAFCAGMDLSDLSWAIGPRVEAGDTFASALRAVRKPVIAAVNGPAITGGFGSPSAPTSSSPPSARSSATRTRASESSPAAA
jgi:enoyl-CoA hydratase